jgi:hypothetical protein
MDTFEDLQQKILLTTTTDKNVSLTLDGLSINYDLDTIPKNFAMGSAGVSWTDGTLNFNTGLGRLASIQEAFQAVQLPPNAFTLKLNDSLLLTDGITDSAVHSKTQSLITDGAYTSLITKDGIDINYNAIGVSSANVVVDLEPNYGNIDVSFLDTVNNVSSQTFIKSQYNQTETSVNVIDPVNGVSAGKTHITIGGAILDTDTATDGTATATQQKNTSYALGANQNQLFTNGSGQTTQHSSTVNSTGTNFTSQTSTSSYQTNFNGASSSSGSSVGANYETLSGSIFTNNGAINVNGGGSECVVSSINVSTGSSQLLRLETPLSGDALIEHNNPSGGRNLGLTTTGNLLITADNMSSTATNLTLTSPSTGNITAPLLTLTNTNTNGSVAMECFKNKPTASVNGEVLFTQSVFGKDSGNAKQEFTRINHTVRDTTAGVEDGSIEFGCFVNGAINTFLQINGNENEINCLRNIDMGGNSIRTSAGNLEITTASSSGAGNMNLTGKSAGITTVSATTLNLTASSILTMSATGAGAYMSATINDDISLTSTAGDIINTMTAGDLVFNGVNIQSSTSSGNSGEHLRIKLNGVYYKIKLEND